jgi:hypothetical protein
MDMTTQTAEFRRLPDVSSKILDIRLAAGGSSEVCPTCGRNASNPYRRCVEDKIIEGCVDAVHTGRLTPISGSNSWHMRNEAIAIRRADYDGLVR